MTVDPGDIVLTRIPKEPSSHAIASVILMTAAFAATNPICSRNATTPAAEAMVTTRPDFRWIMSAAAARVQ